MAASGAGLSAALYVCFPQFPASKNHLYFALDRSTRITIDSDLFHLVFVAHPKPTSEHYGVEDGAYVSCWVNEPTESIAEEVALAAIAEAGWDVERKDQGAEVSSDSYEPDSESGLRFAQALVDGCVLTFHVWNIGAPDDE